MTLVFRKFAAAAALSVPLMFSVAPLAAAAPSVSIVAQSGNDNPAAALENLQSTVTSDLGNNSYPLEGGGLVQGSKLFDPKTHQINQPVYDSLSHKGKKQFVTDLVQGTKKYTDPKNPNFSSKLAEKGVNADTETNWFKQLRSKSGVGTQMLTEVLSHSVNADLTTGAAWFKPFSGPLSSALGFLAIVVISLMGIRSIIDLSYIALPFFQSGYDSLEARISLGGGGGRGTSGGSGGGMKIVSSAARKAVEGSDNGGNPIWIYFKHAALEYILLGIAILFLCFNLMWDFAGFIMDLSAGLLGY